MLEQRHPLGVGLRLAHADLRQDLIADGSADLLDATLCLVQAGWAAQRSDSGYGLPDGIDPLEGWIISCAALDTPAQAN
ncbi:hypothetical protein [Chitinimonas sp.]|uniref:hypothetical protein n=1 Tax=Chitinimonas sp. TaxID=1934313 RepID=UPI0035B3F870